MNIEPNFIIFVVLLLGVALAIFWQRAVQAHWGAFFWLALAGIACCIPILLFK